MAEVSKDLYSVKTLFTLGGASMGVVVATTACGSAFNFNPKWLGLLFAEIVAFGAITQLPKTVRRNWLLYTVAFFNGALIYCQAVGIHDMNASVPENQANKAALLSIPGDRSWFPPPELAEAEAQVTQISSFAQENLDAALVRAKSTEQELKNVQTAISQLQQKADQSQTELKQAKELLTRNWQHFAGNDQNVAKQLSTATEPALVAAIAEVTKQTSQVRGNVSTNLSVLEHSKSMLADRIAATSTKKQVRK